MQLWLDFLQDQTRRFKIGKAIGEEFVSNCGCAEGDAISPISMAWISHLWVGHFRIVAHQDLNNCNFQSYCYADNWQSLTNNAKNTIALLNASAAFCRTCKMQLAPQKHSIFSRRNGSRISTCSYGWISCKTKQGDSK